MHCAQSDHSFHMQSTRFVACCWYTPSITNPIQPPYWTLPGYFDVQPAQKTLEHTTGPWTMAANNQNLQIAR